MTDERDATFSVYFAINRNCDLLFNFSERKREREKLKSFPSRPHNMEFKVSSLVLCQH
jgi:hypothetical protein